jgi:hypothetical protein
MPGRWVAEPLQQIPLHPPCIDPITRLRSVYGLVRGTFPPNRLPARSAVASWFGSTHLPLRGQRRSWFW